MRSARLGLLVIFLLAACDTGTAPPVAPTLEASVGTYTEASSTSTALSVLATTPDSTSTVTITVAGPEGWNGGATAQVTAQPGVISDQVIAAEPVDGDYTLSMTVDGRSYTAASSVSVSSSLDPVGGIVLTEVTASSLRVSWDPVAGAEAYEAKLVEVDSGTVVASVASTNPNATLDVPIRLSGSLSGTTEVGLAAEGDYQIVVIAKSGVGASTTASFADQANRSSGSSGIVNIPAVTHDSLALQGVVGTHNTTGGIQTHIVLRAESTGTRDPLLYTLTGPAGWNNDQPWTAEYMSGPTWQLVAETAPISGEYHFHTEIDGVTYTDSFVADASQLLDLPSGIGITEATPYSVSATWNAVDGAEEYWVNLLHGGSVVDFGFGVVASNAITLDGLDLRVGEEYVLDVRAVSEIPERTPEAFVLQVNSSTFQGEPFQVTHDTPLFQAAAGTFVMDEVALSTNLAVYVTDEGTGPIFVTVTGPPGWYEGNPYLMEVVAGSVTELPALIPPVDGEYLFSAVLGGVTYTDSTVLDSSQVLNYPIVTLGDVTTTSVSASWDAVAGANSYIVDLEMIEGAVLAFEVIAGTTFLLEGLELEAGAELVFAVRASSLPVDRDGSHLNTQPNGSGSIVFLSVPAGD